jgi:hypothetical protein
MDPSPFFYIAIIVYYLLALFIVLQTAIFCHSIRLILCLQQTGEINNLIVSWDKVLGYVVCRFHIAAGVKLSCQLRTSKTSTSFLASLSGVSQS